MNISKSLTFWTLIAGLLAFILRFYFPTFPFDAASILSLMLFALGLIGIVPQLRVQGALTGSIVNSLAFWQLIAGFLAFVIHFFAPAFPFDQVAILAFVLFVLGFFGVHPELRLRGFMNSRNEFIKQGTAAEHINPGDTVYFLPDGSVKKSRSM